MSQANRPVRRPAPNLRGSTGEKILRKVALGGSIAILVWHVLTSMIASLCLRNASIRQRSARCMAGECARRAARICCDFDDLPRWEKKPPHVAPMSALQSEKGWPTRAARAGRSKQRGVAISARPLEILASEDRCRPIDKTSQQNRVEDFTTKIESNMRLNGTCRTFDPL